MAAVQQPGLDPDFEDRKVQKVILEENACSFANKCLENLWKLYLRPLKSHSWNENTRSQKIILNQIDETYKSIRNNIIHVSDLFLLHISMYHKIISSIKTNNLWLKEVNQHPSLDKPLTNRPDCYSCFQYQGHLFSTPAQLALQHRPQHLLSHH